MTFYGLDGENTQLGAYVAEQVTLYRFGYYRTPLRVSDRFGSTVPASTIAITEDAVTTPSYLRLTSTALGTAADDPTDILDLTPTQAARGIQVFFDPGSDEGYIDGNFAVVDTGVTLGLCTNDRDFLIGGNSGLCAPPPSPPPPTTPPSPPPPPLAPPPPCTFDMSFLASGRRLATSAESTSAGATSSNNLEKEEEEGRRLSALPPSPPPFPPPTGPSVCDYSLIVKEDAVVASHAHYGAFAIGGLLIDATPLEQSTVGGTSTVGSLAGKSFHFAGGVTLGAPLPFPFAWSHFEYMAKTLEHRVDSDSQMHVHVLCAGGRVDLARLYRGGDFAGRAGHNTLVVFNTPDNVILGSTGDGRPFFASVLAPFSKVSVEDDAGYVDGFIIAKSFSMTKKGGAVQLHGRCFADGGYPGSMHAVACGTGATNCPANSALCFDDPGIWADKKCRKKLKKRKCHKRKPAMKCRATCGYC